MSKKKVIIIIGSLILFFYIINPYFWLATMFILDRPIGQSSLIRQTQTYLKEKYNQEFKVIYMRENGLKGEYAGRIYSEETGLYFSVSGHELKNGLKLQDDYRLKLWAKPVLEDYLSYAYAYEIRFEAPNLFNHNWNRSSPDDIFLKRGENLTLQLTIVFNDADEKIKSKNDYFKLIKKIKELEISDVLIVSYHITSYIDEKKMYSEPLGNLASTNEENIDEICRISNLPQVKTLKDIELDCTSSN